MICPFLAFHGMHVLSTEKISCRLDPKGRHLNVR